MAAALGQKQAGWGKKAGIHPCTSLVISPHLSSSSSPSPSFTLPCTHIFLFGISFGLVLLFYYYLHSIPHSPTTCLVLPYLPAHLQFCPFYPIHTTACHYLPSMPNIYSLPPHCLLPLLLAFTTFPASHKFALYTHGISHYVTHTCKLHLPHFTHLTAGYTHMTLPCTHTFFPIGLACITLPQDFIALPGLHCLPTPLPPATYIAFCFTHIATICIWFVWLGQVWLGKGLHCHTLCCGPASHLYLFTFCCTFIPLLYTCRGWNTPVPAVQSPTVATPASHHLDHCTAPPSFLPAGSNMPVPVPARFPLLLVGCFLYACTCLPPFLPFCAATIAFTTHLPTEPAFHTLHTTQAPAIQTPCCLPVSAPLLPCHTPHLTVLPAPLPAHIVKHITPLLCLPPMPRLYSCLPATPPLPADLPATVDLPCLRLFSG